MKERQCQPRTFWNPLVCYVMLLCIVSKLLEHRVWSKLYNHVKQFISPLQYGFLRNRSCVTRLLSVLNTTFQNFYKNVYSNRCYLPGLCKTFRLRWSLNFASKTLTIWCGRRRACLVYRLRKWKISKGHFGWCCLVMRPIPARSSSG